MFADKIDLLGVFQWAVRFGRRSRFQDLFFKFCLFKLFLSFDSTVIENRYIKAVRLLIEFFVGSLWVLCLYFWGWWRLYEFWVFERGFNFMLSWRRNRSDSLWNYRQWWVRYRHQWCGCLIRNEFCFCLLSRGSRHVFPIVLAMMFVEVGIFKLWVFFNCK